MKTVKQEIYSLAVALKIAKRALELLPDSAVTLRQGGNYNGRAYFEITVVNKYEIPQKLTNRLFAVNE